MKLNMKNINKIGVFLAILSIFLIGFILFCSNKFNLFDNSVDKLVLKEGTEEEIPLDNWELSTVFYDSTVNNGKTPLTEINWDASDGGYGEGTTRVITMQINYKNTSAVTTYQPGELTISINNLLCGSEPDNWDYWDEYPDSAHLSYSVILGANDDTHTGYEWNYNGNRFTYRNTTYTFTNANVIEENSNFEGSIAIEYTIIPLAETKMDHNYHPYIEEYKDSCTHTFSKMVQASLLYTKITEESTEQINISSNSISFDYIRTYTHPWQEGAYTFTKSAEKLSSYDELPSTVANIADYYWVKYKFDIKFVNNYFNGAYYPYINADLYILDKLTEDCVVYKINGEEVTHENSTYIIDWNDSSSYWSAVRYIIVGYPKSIYNENNNNLELTNYAELYGNYKNGNNDVYQDDASISLNLNDYVFSYSNNQYSISKDIYDYNSGYHHSIPLYYQNLTGDLELGYGGERSFEINFSTKYSGEKYDVKVGDDILYISNVDGSYRKLEEDEYYFTSISVPNFKNGADVVITEKYTVELWIRRAGNTNFELYDSFLNNEKTFTFTENNIVDFYILVKDVTSDLISYRQNRYYHNALSSTIIINANNIATNGTLFNFCYLEVYKNGQLVNEPTIDSYANLITNTNIAQYDIDTYGNYRQRAVASISYSYYESIPIAKKIKTNKYMYDFTQDAANEVFKGKSELSLLAFETRSYTNDYDYIKYYEGESFNPNEGLTHIDLYDLLPLGMEITSTKDEIIESLNARASMSLTGPSVVYSINKTPYDNDSLRNLIKNNTTIDIVQNWNNTGRTWLHINVDLTQSPIYILNYDNLSAQWDNILSYTYSYQVSYDSYLEYGATWENHSYLTATGNIVLDSIVSDDGIKDSDETDINQNSDTTENVSYGSASKTISYIISSHQDVTTYVQTDQSNYSTGIVDTSCNSEYEYKLRVRTGSADVTNLIIYTNLEEAHSGRNYWKGEFLGIDTTYAESKGYTVKTYYSNSITAGILADDTTWKVYDDTVDKSEVKSLAFEYLDSDGNPAVLPANSLTYVLVQMKSPSNENLKSVAYNNCWTQWNAIDPITKLPVDFITGINSNTVKVTLPNSIEPVDIEINLEKIWEDNEDKLTLRPSSINYLLIANGNEETATEITLTTNDVSLTDTNKWSKIIEVPKYDDDGNEIVYTIKEVTSSLENNYLYVPTINDYSITNTLSKEITITKKWIDNNNSYLTRPSNITIKVLQNDTEYKQVIITGDYSTNEWSNKIIVPVYDSEGNEYSYTLEEISVDKYKTTYDSNTYTFTNTLSEDGKIKITKNWIDNSNQYNTRPSSIIVNLKQNSKDYQTITLSGNSDTWSSDEIVVPKYDSTGTKYTYTIEEDIKLSSYGLIEYNQTDLTITNTLKQNIDIIVTKNWLDDNNSYNTRPSTLTITLLQNGKDYKTLILSGNTNTWTSSVEVPKYDDNQVEYQYSIKESNDSIITEYSDVTYGDDGLSVTNKLKKDIDLTITKKWVDYDNEYKTRSESVKINLFQNGVLYKELVLSGDTSTWSTKVEKVPAYDENGIKYLYTIEELDNDYLKKYQKITYDQTTLTVINELTEKPKVTLYFTVKNGYTTNGDDEVKFDEEGLKEVLEKHDLNLEDEYLYEFKLENIVTGEIYKGRLSTQGILEFPDLPYGTYRAVEGEDEYFDFVNMINIEDIPGVTFKEDEKGGIIEIVPTGVDIIYGVNVVNKITMPVVNPPTSSKYIYKLFIVSISFFIVMILFIRKIKKEF